MTVAPNRKEIRNPKGWFSEVVVVCLYFLLLCVVVGVVWLDVNHFHEKGREREREANETLSGSCRRYVYRACADIVVTPTTDGLYLN